MTANYVLLEKITVGAAGASSVEFSGIPQTGYTDLVVKVSARGTDSSVYAGIYVSFNGTAYNSTGRFIEGDGSSASSGTFSNGAISFIAGATATSNTFGSTELYIPNYTGSTNKSYSSDGVGENNATLALAQLNAGLWSNTAAITSITLDAYLSNTFVQGSTFYLYGVAKLGTEPAISPYATGGDTIMTDGTYWYHTFISSGTFTPQKAISCDYLVVAGGGGGGTLYGAGGGAGGLRSTVTATGGGGSLETALSLGTSAYTVTIGAGGNGGTGGANSTNGNNSVFSTITSTGGGAGAGNDLTLNGQQSGGSGGGARSSNTGGAGTANQGYAGGNGAGEAGAGGGGAGSVGQNAASAGIPGNGGSGVNVSITGSSVGYAGGGGGSGSGALGTASSGGGAAGSAGSANTGGGGGSGSGASSSGKNGGSGIVVIRYAV
jgi:hypothetical protein